LTRIVRSQTLIVGAVVLVVVAVAAFLIFGIGTPTRLEVGRVETKTYDDADEWYQPGYTIDGGQTCTGGYGNPPTPQICTDRPDTYIPGVWHTDPERFLLKLRGPHPDDPDKTITDTISVPESFWNTVGVGQWVDVDSLTIVER
jgi:hypothetical protein